MNIRNGSSATWLVAAAQPISGGKAPAAPPMTMFCGVRRFSQTVDQHVEEDRHRQDRRRRPVDRDEHQDDREAGETHAEMERRLPVHPPGGQRPLLRAAHDRVDIRFIPLLSAPAAPAPSAMHRIAVKPSTGWMPTGAASIPHRR